MRSPTSPNVDPGDTAREIVSTRDLTAPPADVFGAFSDPRRLARWWGPAGFTNVIHAFDLRPGGLWHLSMTGPDGTAFHNTSRFLVVEPPVRLSYVHEDPVHRFTMTMTFAALGTGTRLIWQMVFDSAAEAERVRAIIIAANEQNFDRLVQHLSLSASQRVP
jgi:uncharacterized protein YndB with AHSA1/START domain